MECGDPEEEDDDEDADEEAALMFMCDLESE